MLVSAYFPTEQVHLYWPVLPNLVATLEFITLRARGKIRPQATSEVLLFSIQSKANLSVNILIGKLSATAHY
jgi:hypothetical protein